jgi:hypothetical protein
MTNSMFYNGTSLSYTGNNNPYGLVQKGGKRMTGKRMTGKRMTGKRMTGKRMRTRKTRKTRKTRRRHS